MVDARVPGRVAVTREQVRAAELEVEAFRSAGLEPDPMVVRLASAGGGVKTARVAHNGSGKTRSATRSFQRDVDQPSS